jgi:hypothetical protein
MDKNLRSLQAPIKHEFLAKGRKDEVNYPESDYTAEYPF